MPWETGFYNVEAVYYITSVLGLFRYLKAKALRSDKNALGDWV